MKAVTFATVLTLSCSAAPFAAVASEGNALREARALLTAESMETERPPYRPGHGVNFNPSDHVFIKSALAIDFAYRNASVTLPLFRGLSPEGRDVFYIVTECPILKSRTVWASITLPSSPKRLVRLVCRTSHSKTVS